MAQFSQKKLALLLWAGCRGSTLRMLEINSSKSPCRIKQEPTDLPSCKKRKFIIGRRLNSISLDRKIIGTSVMHHTGIQILDRDLATVSILAIAAA